MQRLSTFLWLLVLAPLTVNCGQEIGNKSDTKGFTTKADAEFESVSNKPLIGRRLTSKDDGRAAAHVFYYVDSSEPKMQGALAYEISALREACGTGHKKINWVAYANSHYVVQKKYMVCKAGKFEILDLNIADLDTKMGLVSKASFDNTLAKLSPEQKKLFKDELKVQHQQEHNVGYARAPFAHPEALRSVLKHAYTEVFPSDKFVHFVTIKGHSGEGFAVAGLTLEQEKAKTAAQEKFIVASAHGQLFREKIRYGWAGFDMPKELKSELTKMRLGQLRGRRDSFEAIKKAFTANKTDFVLNSSDDVAGLNAVDPIAGLNVSENPDEGALNASGSASDGGLGWDDPDGGLGTFDDSLHVTATYGMTLETFAEAMRSAGLESKEITKSDVTVGMLMLEACETKVLALRADKEEYQTKYLPIARALGTNGGGVTALYSANGTLNYRNIDWNNFLLSWAAAGGLSSDAQSRLIDELGKVKTLVKRNK